MDRGQNKLFYIRTFGCQMNEHDSVKITGLLASLGFTKTDRPEHAGLLLFNTCTIRQKAHDKAFSEIGRAVVFKNNGSGPLIGVCGCVAQEEGARLLSRFPAIDLVFGPDQIYKLPALLEMVKTQKRPAVATELINAADDYHFLDALETTKLNGPCAYVTIMKGCNSQCAYCIVPQVRGAEVYRSPRDIIREIEFLAERGCREVTLLGQNVNSYPEFGALIRQVAQNTGVDRIRFTSPHPKDVREDLIEEYAVNPKLCPHIHLPLQSGSDLVLRKMQRAYNTKTYRVKVEKLRRARPEIAITTDMIVGFPGEDEAEFQKSLDFVQEIQFDSLFGFAYSPRPGTEAAEIKETVPQEVKDERLQKLFQVQNEISLNKNQRHVGLIEPVLVEGRDKRGQGKLRGRNPQNKVVNFPGQEGCRGDIVEVRVTRALSYSLEGECERHG
ncbi:MAG: tRNA (N6-isopentenyl adenosine(37)-C2)-methylthiotransferase MiaB [Deltaproteobacteria bacterium]|nr:tRNA (N6-isopentenyl adenosine(37)-C2)-methylthiotransferase MiaB [Deltaproteobacteria bacterium]